MGVDLGTTYSVIGIRTKAGPHIIADAEGRVLLPSIVSFAPGGSVKTGYEAQQSLTANPRNTIYNAKRFIGSQYVCSGHGLVDVCAWRDVMFDCWVNALGEKKGGPKN